ncbi:MAG: divergent PAP2 family protein [Candidatus Omnitrophica bacterium]|jgi:hypothetical protein|nr:divergent PAP2 family protein [Candidatus Omnitrophota bacterium]
MRFIVQIACNKVFIVTLICWFTAQLIKIAVSVIREKSFDFKWLIGTGGMPSSHCAATSALAVALGMSYGFDSGVFAIGLGFAIVTMFDAQGARRAIGKQAEILNKMMEDIYSNRSINEERLAELIGHTPVQVLAGALFGAFMSYFLYLII